MKRLILLFYVSLSLFAQAPQVADTVALKDTRNAVNTAFTSLYNSIQTALSGKQPTITGAPSTWPTAWPWGSLSGVPTTFAPSAHKSAHATGGSDALAPTDIGAAASSHAHTGVYEPVDTTLLRQANLAGSGAATTPARSDHNHSGTYEPVDAAIVRKDASGNVSIGASVPEGAPSGSVGFAGKLYQNGVEFVGGGGSGVPYSGATQDVDLGQRKLAAKEITVGSGDPTHIDVVATTVSNLPTTSIPSERHMLVSDGVDASDCSVGGGSNRHWCYWSGSAWVAENSTGPQGVVAATAPITYNAGTKAVACPTCTVTVASGAAALGISAIASASCASVVSETALGVLTTDTVTASFDGDPTGATGYIPATTGMLTIFPYPSVDGVNFKVCNNTASAITPAAVTINWRVVR